MPCSSPLCVLLLLFSGMRVSLAANISFGVCWYPEQWSSVSLLESDVSRMVALGLGYVRLGEFMWSSLEPESGRYNWTVLDNALDALASSSLHAIIGTPTASPPKWLVDRFPSMLPVSSLDMPRKWGSRRHYSFSSPDYLAATKVLVTAMAQRYGQHPAVRGWQVDNELGCHDTVMSYDVHALAAFKRWLQTKYGDVATLNTAWGLTFWGMGLTSFEQVELPDLTVTEPNPAVQLDFAHFSSQQLLKYNQLQVEILRAHSPNRFVTTNLMGFFFQFDAFALGDVLDFVTWDSYPLGFTDTSDVFSDTDKVKFSLTGHPDLASFHHDLYRAVGRGRWGVMEQQPGPVNWGSHNPCPAPGMIRLWTWEAIAHGAQLVSYFRWRQAPFAQEQMHSGLNQRNNQPAPGLAEAKQAIQEAKEPTMAARLEAASPHGSVGLAFDFPSFWAYTIQPQGKAWVYTKLVYEFYSALRSLGMEVDFVHLNAPVPPDLSQYVLVVVPSIVFLGDSAMAALLAFKGTLVLGPRTASKTQTFQVPLDLPPACSGPHGPSPQKDLLPIQVVRVASFRPDYFETVRLVHQSQLTYNFSIWREWLAWPPMTAVDTTSSSATVVTTTVEFADGSPAVVLAQAANGRNTHYLAFWPPSDFLRDFLLRLISALPATARVASPLVLPGSLRLSRLGSVEFAFNYDHAPVQVPAYLLARPLLLGVDVRDGQLVPYGVAAWDCSCKQNPQQNCCQRGKSDGKTAEKVEVSAVSQ
eukprot:gb/GEZN01001613.1/.p1 GENE.gb/GEZN01001613.1/~~gb/GEZN01001613.1/.p1  ORF type:complete len:752 (-),score=137.90 gb/GEZN01001613.1/:632-2887(-)